MEEENGLTLGEIFKVILKRIWWVVGAAALCVIAAVLVTQLWYNKVSRYYSIRYEILYPDSASGKYPDGKDFVISDSISLNTLEDIVIGSGGEFEGVKVDNMVANDGIKVSQSVTKIDDGTFAKTYTLTVFANYFKNDGQAVEFMKAVANYPVNLINATVRGREYELYLTMYDNAKTYGDKISALSLQKEYLENSYSSLMAYDRSLDIKLAELRSLFTSAQMRSLLDMIDSNYYVLDTDEYILNAKYRESALQKEIEDNQKIIAVLREEREKSNGGQDVLSNAYDNRIAELVTKNAEMQNEQMSIRITLEEIEKYTDEGSEAYAEKQKFDSLLEEYRAELVEATAQLKTTTIELFKQNSRVIYAGNKVSKQGGMGAISAACAGLLLGLVVACAVVCIIDLPKYKRAKLTAAGVGEGADVKTADANVEAEAQPEGGDKAE